jgi:5'-methylthioadenosine phosphorylase
MGRIAVILGSSAHGPRGEEIAAAAAAQGALVWQRHGDGDYRLPHRIDHAANFRSLLEAGCDRAVGVSSVGSLKADLGIGSFICPDDFIAPQATSSIHEDVRGHMVPGFDHGWRGQVLSAWAAAGIAELHDGGVYWQMTGPRFETPAEVRLLAEHADVVGMTVGSECIAASELGVPYAAVCVIDNMANGIGPGPLSVEEIEAVRDVNTDLIRDAVAALLPELSR